jgi:general secretion pathway protein G
MRARGFFDRTGAALGHPWPPRHSRFLRISGAAVREGSPTRCARSSWPKNRPVCGFADRTEARAAGQGRPVCGFADRTEARAAGQGRPVCGFADRTEARAAGQGRPVCGFTLIELVLTLFIVALLASLIAPIVTGNIVRARESTLKQDLYTLRKAIDDYHSDHGGYPTGLEALVEKRYLRRIPVDPMTERADSWMPIHAKTGPDGKGGGVMDVRSGSDEKAADGVPYRDW